MVIFHSYVSLPEGNIGGCHGCPAKSFKPSRNMRTIHSKNAKKRHAKNNKNDLQLLRSDMAGPRSPNDLRHFVCKVRGWTWIWAALATSSWVPFLQWFPNNAFDTLREKCPGISPLTKLYQLQNTNQKPSLAKHRPVKPPFHWSSTWLFFADYIAKDGLFWKLGSQFPISRAHPNIFCWIYECRSYYIISPITHMYFSKIWCVYNIDLITSYYILSPITHIIHNIWWFKLSIKSIIWAVPSSSFQGKKNLDPREDPTQVAKTPQRNALLLPAVRPPAMKKNHRKTGFQGAICIDIEYVCVCVYI